MNNQLTVTGTQSFMGIEIPVVLGGFGADRKSICDKTIAEIHGMNAFDVRRRITDNIKRFADGVDFIDLAQRMREAQTSEIATQLGYSKQAITQAERIYILSERGYAKLIKIMDTDLAWEVHDKLIDEYFEMREHIKQIPAPKSAMDMLRLQSAALFELEDKVNLIEDKLDNQMTIDHGQQRTIQQAVAKRVYERAAEIYPAAEVKVNAAKLFQAAYRDIKTRFGVASYRDIRPVDYKNAIASVESWIEPATLRVRA